MSDEKTIEALVAGQRLLPDQWYAVRASAFVRRTAAGRVETKGLQVNMVEVDGPDAPMPPETETPEPEPKA
jgi:hypothetical protein